MELTRSHLLFCLLLLHLAALARAASDYTNFAQARLTNISVRSNAGADSNTLIVGFVLAGSSTKPVLVRGIGPTLAEHGVVNPVSDPQLRLFTDGAMVGGNDAWGGDAVLASTFAQLGAFALPAGSRDAALLSSLPPGPHTAHLLPASGTGVALVECYDPELGQGAGYFTNVSARTHVGTGADVLIAGFVVSGTEPKLVLIRGIGPALASLGVTGVLAQPQLRLFDSAGRQLGDNTGWNSSVTPAGLFSNVGAFSLPARSLDAVLFVALPPGIYTAQVSGVGGTTGTALVEVYTVDVSPVPFVTLQPVANPAAPPPYDSGAGGYYPGPDTVPSPVNRAAPLYPFALRQASLTGEVLVDFYVKSDGTVGNAVALSGTDMRFADSAVAAVQTWTFTVGRKNGVRVTTHFQVPIIFNLQ